MAANALSGPHGRDISLAEATSTAPVANAPLDQITFADVLDALNPLQYVPVVGTIYRVCTGDQGSPALRTAMSMVTGALTGGPVGLFTSIVGTLVERFFHIEQTARSLMGGSKATPRLTATPEPGPAGDVPRHGPDAAMPPASAPVPSAVARDAAAAYARTEALTARITWGGRER